MVTLEAGHYQKCYCEKNNKKIYTNTITTAAAIIVTGNNYEKFFFCANFSNCIHSVKVNFHACSKEICYPSD